MTALISAAQRTASQITVLAKLGEAIIANRVTGSPGSRARLLALADLAYAVSVVSASERLSVIWGAK